jgi:hypothetical protein
MKSSDGRRVGRGNGGRGRGASAWEPSHGKNKWHSRGRASSSQPSGRPSSVLLAGPRQMEETDTTDDIVGLELEPEHEQEALGEELDHLELDHLELDQVPWSDLTRPQLMRLALRTTRSLQNKVDDMQMHLSRMAVLLNFLGDDSP